MLVAIAIPVFTSQLEKSRESVDLSNIRAAYAEVMSAALTNDTTPDDTSITYNNGTWTKNVDLKQQQDGWQTDMTNVEVGGSTAIGSFNPTKGGSCAVSFDGTTVSFGAATGGNGGGNGGS